MSTEKEDNLGLKLAQAVKYYLQFQNQRIVNPLPIERISAIGFYNENRRTFDVAARLYKHLELDVKEYASFLVSELKMTRYSIKRYLLSTNNIKLFVEKKQIKLKKSKIYKYFQKSADFVSTQAAELGYITTIDYLREMIKQRKLASYYVSGKISKYYFAAIPKFPQLAAKLDSISKDEFQPLCNKYEKYQIDVREAMKQENNKVVGVLSYTDRLISQKRENLLSGEIDIAVPDVEKDNTFRIDPNS